MAREIYEDYDEVTETPKEGFGNGIVIMTFLVLLAACFFMQRALKVHYEAGMFADKQAANGQPEPVDEPGG